ncbi:MULTISPECIES: hypothetical protein [Rhizobium]|uniref:Uncharacterized protein n=2 Tax=Rhizobium dioscoreae TaxID=2653122 RepID=A0ABQ0Z744_9HYPH|nr:MULTISPECIES: hypothetical protein [Rhizobium]GES41176.1 hypothetical protein RsS62_04280 [Rhizobium dioscoreae]GES51295.1 hypothetical protein RsS93_39090 [Rhizobium dioscoreae]GLU82747.1 hypothetical protein Rhsp01_39230 [Rhizobium sp. NBRC 114257]
MMADDRKLNDREELANDNQPPDGQEGAGKAEASERLNAIVLSIARLIGRQMAREHFEALRAASDNRGRSEDSAEDDNG